MPLRHPPVFLFWAANTPQQVLCLFIPRSSAQNLDPGTKAFIVFLECGDKVVVEDVSSRLPAVTSGLGPLHEISSPPFPKQAVDEILVALHAGVACVSTSAKASLRCIGDCRRLRRY